MKKTFFLLFFFMGQFAFGQSIFFNYNDAHFSVGQRKVLRKLYFDFDKYSIRPESDSTLDSIFVFMKTHDSISIEIGCHTDYKGAVEYNLKLTQMRSEAIVKYLISRGIKQKRLKAKGYGESQPWLPNKNPDGTDNYENMSKNRRTELKIISTHK